MRIFVSGHSPRERCFSALCLKHGHLQPAYGPWDLAVLPLPVSSMEEDLADQLPRGQRIVCGKPDDALKRLAWKRGWQLINILEKESFLQENANLTAEGAVFYAMKQSDAAIKGSDCLVIGYGRIGKALTEKLRALGANVTVAARRKESQDQAGKNSVSIGDIPQVIGSCGFVFNTVPTPVLDENCLRSAGHDTLFFELASKPYGIDMDAAEKMGKRVFLESGIPGRYCPKTAAEAMLRCIETEVQHE